MGGVKFMSSAQRIMDSIMRSNPYFYMLLKLITTRHAQLVDQLTRVKTIGYYSHIAEQLKMDPERLAKIVKMLIDKGFKFVARFHPSKIGLIEYFIYLDKYVEFETIPPLLRSFLKFYGKTILLKGTIIQVYTPYNYYNQVSKLIYEWIKELGVENEIVFPMITENTQPSLSKYKLEDHPLINGYNLNELMKAFNETTEHRPEFYVDIHDLKDGDNRPRDIVDLILIKEFEKDAFIPLKKISSIYNIEEFRLKRHLIEHLVEKSLVKGIYISPALFVKAFNSMRLFLCRVNDKKLFYKWLNFLPSIQNTLMIGFSLSKQKSYYIYAGFIPGLKGYSVFEELFTHAVKEGFLDDYISFEFLESSIRKFTIPYKAYYQDLKNWSIDVERTHSLFDRRILRKT